MALAFVQTYMAILHGALESVIDARRQQDTKQGLLYECTEHDGQRQARQLEDHQYHQACEGINRHSQTGKQHLDNKTLDVHVTRQGMDHKGRERLTEGAESQHLTGKGI